MRILVANDDGIDAAGIRCLVKALAQVEGVEVYVAAPTYQQSAMSHSLSVRGGVPVKEVDFPYAKRAFSIEGRPADCVRIGIDILKEAGTPVDVLYTGINHGYNIGRDVHYSATIGSAMEGLICGVPSVAMSTEMDWEAAAGLTSNKITADQYGDEQFAAAAQAAAQLVPYVKRTEPLICLNVNVASIPPEEVKGWKVTSGLGGLTYDIFAERTKAEDGRDAYQYHTRSRSISGEGTAPDTDGAAVQAGYVSISPLQIDITAYPWLEHCRQVASQLNGAKDEAMPKGGVSYDAYAKVNLLLQVLNRRADGYHELSTVFQALKLADRVTVAFNDTNDIRLTITGLPEGEALPTDHRNLAYRAAEAILAKGQGTTIVIDKRIPLAAGLAGGSSDAAAVLLALNELQHQGRSLEDLCAIGLQLGADVPFCLWAQAGRSAAALAGGIGEKLEELPSWKGHVLLVRPNVQISTKDIFGALGYGYRDNLINLSDTGFAKQRTRRVWGELLIAQNRKQLVKAMSNDLEPVACQQCPVISDIRRALLLGTPAPYACQMSGSGPTVFAFYDTEEEACAAQKAIQKQFADVLTVVTETL